MPIVLENSGVIEPERIESYIAAGGYQALHHALREMTPAEVVDEITAAACAAAAAPAIRPGVKWGTVAKMPGAAKYVICNADEGDPGAFMDRSVLESDPHRVLEGMAIAAYAVGASQGYIYVRGEYPLAIHRLEIAIRQARRLGLLGSGIFESPFNFRIDLRIGAGAFVCGEETALMASIEGKRGMPRPRPPYPAEEGLWECPDADQQRRNVRQHSRPSSAKGPEWFAGIGTAKSKGTKVFALAGKINNTGLVEVPMGMSLRTIVEEIGGGAPDGGTIKAVQTGGPSGGCIPAKLLDTPVDYESLAAARLHHGLGRHDRHGPDHQHGRSRQVFHGILHGRIVRQMHSLPRRDRADASPAEPNPRRRGDGKPTSSNLEKLCDMVKNTSLCGLGQTAPNPVLSTLGIFAQEYETLLTKTRRPDSQWPPASARSMNQEGYPCP